LGVREKRDDLVRDFSCVPELELIFSPRKDLISVLGYQKDVQILFRNEGNLIEVAVNLPF
jgi:hypothetical protein